MNGAQRQSRMLIVATILIAGLVTTSFPSVAQDQKAEALGACLALFEVSEWQERARGFYGLLNLAMPDGFRGRTWAIQDALRTYTRSVPSREDEIRVALIQLLERENTVVRARGTLTEDYADYWANVIGAVAGLRDPRAIKALVENLDTGNMATQGVAALGDLAVGPVLQVAEGGPDRRNAAIRTLAQMLDPTNRGRLSEVSQARIKMALMNALQDGNRFVRTSAIGGLAHLPGEDVTAALRAIARDDPFRLRDASGHSFIYPVRVAAEQALRSRPK